MLKQRNINFYDSHAEKLLEEKRTVFWRLFGEQIISKWGRKGCVILDVCCGAGFIQEHIHQEILNLDISKKCLLQLTGKIRIQADVENLPLKSGSVDMVIDSFALHHAPNLKVAIQEIYRVLKVHGVFFAFEGSKKPSKQHETHALYDPTDFVATIKNADFNVKTKRLNPILFPRSKWNYNNSKFLSKLMLYANHTPLAKRGIHLLIEAIKQ